MPELHTVSEMMIRKSLREKTLTLSDALGAGARYDAVHAVTVAHTIAPGQHRVLKPERGACLAKHCSKVLAMVRV